MRALRWGRGRCEGAARRVGWPEVDRWKVACELAPGAPVIAHSLAHSLLNAWLLPVLLPPAARCSASLTLHLPASLLSAPLSPRPRLPPLQRDVQRESCGRVADLAHHLAAAAPQAPPGHRGRGRRGGVQAPVRLPRSPAVPAAVTCCACRGHLLCLPRSPAAPAAVTCCACCGCLLCLLRLPACLLRLPAVPARNCLLRFCCWDNESQPTSRSLTAAAPAPPHPPRPAAAARRRSCCPAGWAGAGCACSRRRGRAT